MAFEELTSRQAVMWGSAPFENIAEPISDMHVELVEHLEPVAGRASGSISGAVPGTSHFTPSRAGAVVTGSDLSPDARRGRAAARGGARPRPHARGRRLPEPSLRRRVVRRRLLVGGRDLRARPRACCPRARPRLPARWPRRPDRLAKGERRRRDVRRDVAVHAAAAAGRRLAVPVGRRGVRRVDARRRLRALVRGARLAPYGDYAGEMWEVFRENYGPSFTLWSSLDDERRAELDADMDGVLREPPRQTTGSASSGATSSSRACARADSRGALTRAAGSRGPRR